MSTVWNVPYTEGSCQLSCLQYKTNTAPTRHILPNIPKIWLPKPTPGALNATLGSCSLRRHTRETDARKLRRLAALAAISTNIMHRDPSHLSIPLSVLTVGIPGYLSVVTSMGLRGQICESPAPSHSISPSYSTIGVSPFHPQQYSMHHRGQQKSVYVAPRSTAPSRIILAP